MDSKNTALEEAVEKGDIESVSKLLEQGRDPNILLKSKTKLFYSPMTQNHSEVFKLLVKYGLVIDQEMMEEMFKEPGCRDQAIELVTFILNHYNKDTKIFHIIFGGLTNSDRWDGNIKILEFLLDQGMPVNDCYEYRLCGFEPSVPSLHYCISNGKYNFMTLLIQRGADIEKETPRGRVPPLFAANDWNDADAAEILLKHGAQRNKYHCLDTALAEASEKRNWDIMQVLLDYGADINLSNEAGLGPVRFAYPESKEVLLREIAMMKLDGREICGDNFKYLQVNKKANNYIDRCLNELKKMKKCIVYNNLSLYDVLKMQKNYKKLIFLLKNDRFVKALQSSMKRVSKSLKLYDYRLECLIKKNLKSKDILETEEKKLYSIFKGILPELIINKVAYEVAYISTPYD